MNSETMREMGEPESSVKFWMTRTVDWNGNPVTVREPARNWVNQEDGE